MSGLGGLEHLNFATRKEIMGAMTRPQMKMSETGNYSKFSSLSADLKMMQKVLSPQLAKLRKISSTRSSRTKILSIKFALKISTTF